MDEPTINAWAKKKYNVSFKMFSKVDVNGIGTHEVFKFLRKNSALYDNKT